MILVGGRGQSAVGYASPPLWIKDRATAAPAPRRAPPGRSGGRCSAAPRTPSRCCPGRTSPAVHPSIGRSRPRAGRQLGTPDPRSPRSASLRRRARPVATAPAGAEGRRRAVATGRGRGPDAGPSGRRRVLSSVPSARARFELACPALEVGERPVRTTPSPAAEREATGSNHPLWRGEDPAAPVEPPPAERRRPPIRSSAGSLGRRDPLGWPEPEAARRQARRGGSSRVRGLPKRQRGRFGPVQPRVGGPDPGVCWGQVSPLSARRGGSNRSACASSRGEAVRTVRRRVEASAMRRRDRSAAS